MARPTILKDVQFSGIRGIIADFVENRNFIGFIALVIFINAATLGLETNQAVMARHGTTLLLLDKIALSIFVIEIALKLFIYRLNFFRAGWNVFDFVIISIAFVPAVGPLSILRALRIFRILRLISIVPQMRRVVGALLHSIPGIASVIAVLLIIFYVAAVLVTTLFGKDFEMLFGSLSASMFTLFQIMTLEGWADEVVRPVMKVYPLSWMFFIPFIIITSFAVLNLFIGIIVDAMNTMGMKNKLYTGPDRRKAEEKENDIKEMRAEIAEIKQILIERDRK